MAWLFDADTDYVTMADDAVLTLPDADWTICGWVQQTTTSYSIASRIFEWTSAPSFASVLMIPTAGAADEVRFTLNDGVDEITATSTASPFSGNTSWTHFLLERNGSNVNLYVNNSSVATVAVGLLDAVDCAAVFRFGNSAASDRSFRANEAEFAKWDRVMTADERAALSNGYAPIFFRNSLKWYVPMVREYVEVINNLAITNNGTTVSDHPRIIYPAYTLIGKPSAQAQTISLSGLASTSALGTQSILLNITANGVASTTAIGTAVVANTQIISLSGLASASALGTPSIKLNIDLSGFVNSQAFGSSTLILNVSPSGLANTSALGTPDVRLNITATGLSNTQAFGTPVLSYEQTIAILGIPSTSVIGTHIIADTNIIVTTGLDSSTAFGTPVIFTRNFEVVTPTTGDFVRVDI